MSLGSSLVERCPEEAGVASSILAPGTRGLFENCGSELGPASGRDGTQVVIPRIRSGLRSA